MSKRFSLSKSHFLIAARQDVAKEADYELGG